MKRKLISFFLTAAMVVTSVPMTFAASVTDFKDVQSGSWYYENVKTAVDKGYMNGIAGDTFAPDETMTRAMYVVVLSRMEGATVNNNEASGFSDVETGQWYTGAINWAKTNGIVQGYSATEFGTFDAMSRQDFATMLSRYINSKSNLNLKDNPAVDSFSDMDEVASYAKDAVEFCRLKGLVQGREVTTDSTGKKIGTFAPKASATRAEGCTMFVSAKNVIDSASSGTVTPTPSNGGGGGGGGGGSSSSTTYSVNAEVDFTPVVTIGGYDDRHLPLYENGSGNADNTRTSDYTASRVKTRTVAVTNALKNVDGEDISTDSAFDVLEKAFNSGTDVSGILSNDRIQDYSFEISNLEGVGAQSIFTKTTSGSGLAFNKAFIVAQVSTASVLSITDENGDVDESNAIITELVANANELIAKYNETASEALGDVGASDIATVINILDGKDKDGKTIEDLTTQQKLVVDSIADKVEGKEAKEIYEKLTDPDNTIVSASQLEALGLYDSTKTGDAQFAGLTEELERYKALLKEAGTAADTASVSAEASIAAEGLTGGMDITINIGYMLRRVYVENYESRKFDDMLNSFEGQSKYSSLDFSKAGDAFSKLSDSVAFYNLFGRDHANDNAYDVNPDTTYYIRSGDDLAKSMNNLMSALVEIEKNVDFSSWNGDVDDFMNDVLNTFIVSIIDKSNVITADDFVDADRNFWNIAFDNNDAPTLLDMFGIAKLKDIIENYVYITKDGSSGKNPQGYATVNSLFKINLSREDATSIVNKMLDVLGLTDSSTNSSKLETSIETAVSSIVSKIVGSSGSRTIALDFAVEAVAHEV